MIDKIRMNTIIIIPVERLQDDPWIHRRIPHNDRLIDYYVCTFRKLYICYNPSTSRLSVIGRLMVASIIPDRVSNLDRLYAGVTANKVIQEHHQTENGLEVTYSYEAISQNLDELIQEVNDYLYFLTSFQVDINKFHVTYLEVCFNVNVGHVENYIELFNLIFERQAPAKYANFVLQRKEVITGSFYVKGKIQYRKAISTGFVINFYNKTNEIWRRLTKISHKTSAANRDNLDIDEMISLLYSLGDLRMEVQCHYNALYFLYGKERPFEDFKNLNNCRDLVVKKYEMLIGPTSCDFYSLEKAILLINQSDLSPTVKKNLCQQAIDYDMNIVLYKPDPDEVISEDKLKKREYITEFRYKHKMISLGIHWFFIPARMGIDYLESPIKELDRWVLEVERDKKTYFYNRYRDLLEAAMVEQIDESDDDMVIVEAQRQKPKKPKHPIKPLVHQDTTVEDQHDNFSTRGNRNEIKASLLEGNEKEDEEEVVKISVDDLTISPPRVNN